MIPQTCSRKELADLLDLSGPRITMLTQSGVLTKGRDGTYALRGNVRAYLRFLRSTPGDLKQERQRFIQLKADLLDLKLKQQTGELVRRDAVETATYRAYRTTRDNFENIPARMSGVLASMGGQQEAIHSLLMKEIHQ